MTTGFSLQGGRTSAYNQYQTLSKPTVGVSTGVSYQPKEEVTQIVKPDGEVYQVKMAPPSKQTALQGFIIKTNKVMTADAFMKRNMKSTYSQAKPESRQSEYQHEGPLTGGDDYLDMIDRKNTSQSHIGVSVKPRGSGTDFNQATKPNTSHYSGVSDKQVSIFDAPNFEVVS